MVNGEMEESLVSTIIPVYNRPKMLKEAVASVVAQTYRPIEIIIVDDGSTDETPRVADDLADTHPGMVFAIHKVNGGPGLAREDGRLRARGEFIQYLDSDDILLPDKFDRQVSGLKDHPECGVSYGWTRFRHTDGTIESMPWKGSGIKTDAMFPSFLVSRWWDTPSPLYRASLCSQAGPWTDLRLEEDWEYDCRIASLGVQLHYTDAYVSEVRDHEENRLCRGAALDPIRLKERAKSHILVFGHARKAGIREDSAEMRRYARELFLISRQCGAAGLPQESRRLFELARQASGPVRGNGMDFRFYRILAGMFGWTAAGNIACFRDRFR
jgi:glycosyltransferase involved in cell wall biosynthesis